MSIGRALRIAVCCRPIATSTPRTKTSNAGASSAVVTRAATLRNAGPATPPTGGVS